MRLTTMTDYSLRLLMYVAQRPEQLCTIAEVAAAYGISEAHLMKITHQLGLAGFIETVRGKGGGMRLGGDPKDIVIGAVVAAAVGYAEGGLLARELGAWQTVSWALVISLPLMTVLAAVSVVAHPPVADGTEWAAFAYLAAVSMFLGFFAWYRGLAIGPMAHVSQTQLTQPVMTIAWATLLLHERLTWPTLFGGAAVIVCALSAVRARAGVSPAESLRTCPTG